MPRVPMLARLHRDIRGASVIETAVILPTLLMLMAGASDMAMAFWTKMQTQQAAARTIELATAGGLDNLSTTTLQSEAASAASVSTSKVTVNEWLECDGVTQSTFNMGCNSGQVTGRYVSVKINNSYKPILGPLLPASIAHKGSISFSGYSSLRLQ